MYISDLLQKFKHITPPDITVRKSAVDIIKTTTNIELDKKDISIKNGVVYIKTQPIYKNEIFINKQKIIKKLQERVGDNVFVKDLR